MISLRSLAISATAAFALGSTQAAYLVDTGPGSGTNWALNSERSLAATFSLSVSTWITGVEGWVGGGSGPVGVKLIDGARPNGSVLHSAMFGALKPNTWAGNQTPSWVLAPGEYTLVFSAVAGFDGWMQGGAPKGLASEWITRQGGWVAFDEMDLGVRITGKQPAIPEPQSYVLMALGLAGIAARLRRRRLGPTVSPS